MPHLRGFTKTLRFNLLMPVKGEEQASCTTALYRKAVSYYLQVFQDHQDLIGHSQWLKMAENLTHRTEDNPDPEYPFDEEFPNLPSGFRRNAIAEARGKALAWKTSFEKWEEKKRKHEERNQRRVAAGKKPVEFTERPPQYPEDDNCWLSYYGTEYRWLDSNHIMLKMFTGKAYVSRKVTLLQPFIVPPGYAAGSPMLVEKPTGWELYVPIVQVVKFAKHHGARIIVFEYLDDLKPEKGSKSHYLNQKFNHWVKGRIFRYTQYKALHEGIITCRVPPKETSSRCPYCGFLTIVRYNKGKDGKETKGVDLAKCTNCGVHDVNADYIGTLGIGRNFRFKYLSPAG